LPRLFAKKKGKDSEFINVETKENLLIQIGECMPTDDLCKMPDFRRDIQEFA
jgi:hypothetical protein